MSSLNFFKKNAGFYSRIIPKFFLLRNIQQKIPFQYLFGLLVILLFYLSCSNTAYAQTAANLPTTINVSSGLDAKVLNDVNYSTRLEIPAQTTITITSSSPIYGLYLYWDQAANGWQLQSGNSSNTYGQYEMLHEYVKIDTPSNTVTMTIPNAGSILCEIRALGSGDLPSNIQTWLPPCETADILLLPAHAGDESLVFGGTIPYYAGELGKNVQVAYISSHYPDEVYREHEKLNALWAMGLRNYPVMGKFEDKFTSGHVTSSDRYDYDAVLEYIVTQIRRFKPLVVIGHDLNGEYGHGLHMVAAKATQNAMTLSKDKTYHIASADQYGLWEPTKTYLHLYKENPIHMDWNKTLSKLGGKTALELAKEGFKLNDSQQWTNFQVSDTGKNNCADFGLFLSSVGPDKKGGDFMENVVPHSERSNTNSSTKSTEKLDADISAGESTTSSSETSSAEASESSSATASASESAPSTTSESVSTESSNRFKSFEQSYIEIEPLALKIGSICIVIVAIGSFISLFIKKK